MWLLTCSGCWAHSSFKATLKVQSCYQILVKFKNKKSIVKIACLRLHSDKSHFQTEQLSVGEFAWPIWTQTKSAQGTISPSRETLIMWIPFEITGFYLWNCLSFMSIVQQCSIYALKLFKSFCMSNNSKCH